MNSHCFSVLVRTWGCRQCCRSERSSTDQLLIWKQPSVFLYLKIEARGALGQTGHFPHRVEHCNSEHPAEHVALILATSSPWTLDRAEWKGSFEKRHADTHTRIHTLFSSQNTAIRSLQKANMPEWLWLFHLLRADKKPDEKRMENQALCSPQSQDHVHCTLNTWGFLQWLNLDGNQNTHYFLMAKRSHLFTIKNTTWCLLEVYMVRTSMPM